MQEERPIVTAGSPGQTTIFSETGSEMSWIARLRLIAMPSIPVPACSRTYAA
jgi:hypothetical protein